MENLSILSVASFILNTILISGFIIPQVQKLKEIKDQLIRFKITSLLVPEDGDRVALEKQSRNDLDALHKLFDMYAIRSKELSKLVAIFYISIFMAVLALIFTKFFGNQHLYYFSQFSYTEVIKPFHLLIQLSLLICAINLYAVNPDKLQNIQYLVDEMFINPNSVVDAMKLGLIYSRGSYPLSSPINEMPVRISLNVSLRVFGYKYLYLIYGNDKKVYYVSVGMAKSSSKNLLRAFGFATQYNQSGEYSSITMGYFKFGLVEKQTLRTTLLIYLPSANEESSPLIIDGSYEALGKDSKRLIIGQSGGESISPAMSYPKVIYKADNKRITEVRFDNGRGASNNQIRDSVIQRIIETYGSKIYDRNFTDTSLDGNI